MGICLRSLVMFSIQMKVKMGKAKWKPIKMNGSRLLLLTVVFLLISGVKIHRWPHQLWRARDR